MADHGSDRDVGAYEILDGYAGPSWDTGPTEPHAPVRPYGRRTAVAAVVVSTVLVLVAATWFGVSSRTRHQTRTITAPAVTGLDAGGCPVGASCRIDATRPSALEREAVRWFPDWDVDYATSVRDVDVRTVYRQTVLLTSSAGSVVLAVASCVPHGRAIAVPSVISIPDSPATVQTVLTPGARAGCSTAVTGPSDADDALSGAMTRLSQDGANYG